MNLNRGMLWATVATAAMLVVGGVTVTVVGIDRPADAGDPGIGNEQAEPEQSAGDDGDATETASNVIGTEQYRGGGSHGVSSSRGGGSRAGASHGGGSHAGASHGGGYGHTGGYGHAGGYGRGYGHAGGYGRGWGGSRWGHWGGGRYVGGRWIGGPYYGWCDDRYYACNRSWW